MASLRFEITLVTYRSRGCEIDLAANPDHLAAANCVLVADVNRPVPTTVGPGVYFVQESFKVVLQIWLFRIDELFIFYEIGLLLLIAHFRMAQKFSLLATHLSLR
jgi:hypothetical protein